jgi:hypothetical protein
VAVEEEHSNANREKQRKKMIDAFPLGILAKICLVCLRFM